MGEMRPSEEQHQENSLSAWWHPTAERQSLDGMGILDGGNSRLICKISEQSAAGDIFYLTRAPAAPAVLHRHHPFGPEAQFAATGLVIDHWQDVPSSAAF